MESLSEKKAIRARREARLISSQKGHYVGVTPVSAWAVPKHKTHSRDHQRCAGEPRTSDSYGTAIATTPINLLF